MTTQKNNSVATNRKLTKIGLIFIIIFGLVFFIWNISKPFRLVRANAYLSKGRVIDILKASLLNPASPQIHLKLGRTYFIQGDFQKAKQEYQKALRYCRNCSESSEISLETKKLSILHSLKEGDLKQTQDLLAGGLELNSADPETQFYYGVFLAAEGEYSQASKALQFATKNEDIERQRKLLLSVLEKITPTDYASQNPYHPVLIGVAFLKMGYESLAINQFEKATNLDPRYRDAWIWLAKGYFGQANYYKAANALQKAAEVDPIYSETFLLLAKTYESLGEKDKANEAIEKARVLGWKE